MACGSASRCRCFRSRGARCMCRHLAQQPDDACVGAGACVLPATCLRTRDTATFRSRGRFRWRSWNASPDHDRHVGGVWTFTQELAAKACWSVRQRVAAGELRPDAFAGAEGAVRGTGAATSAGSFAMCRRTCRWSGWRTTSGRSRRARRLLRREAAEFAPDADPQQSVLLWSAGDRVRRAW